MHDLTRFLIEHQSVTRRHFLKLGAAGLATVSLSRAVADDAADDPELEAEIEKFSYLTPTDDFRTVERVDPPPHQLSLEDRTANGLERDTWSVEIVADPDATDPKTAPQVGRPMTKEEGTALDWAGLMKLADKNGTGFAKVICCNNIGPPLGMGIWEGVPLRDVILLAEPKENIRRVHFHGFHNGEPKQLFRGSLSLGRILEDPPGMPPVILCYKLNGELLNGKRGGPVRMMVPEAYGFKCVKWINRITLTNSFHANDTYADANNDVDSDVKTFARFLYTPRKVKAGQPIPLTGIAQVGISGLKRVQVWASLKKDKLPEDDPYFTHGDWQDVEILPAPTEWGGDLPDNEVPANLWGFDPETRRPETWPLRFASAHWAGLLPPLPEGRYFLRCRTIDEKGHAQPLPRPYRKSGRNEIEEAALLVEA